MVITLVMSLNQVQKNMKILKKWILQINVNMLMPMLWKSENTQGEEGRVNQGGELAAS